MGRIEKSKHQPLQVNPQSIKNYILNNLFIVIWILGLFYQLFLPVFSINKGFIIWSSIPVYNYIKLIFTFLISSFYLGFYIIKIVKWELNWIENIFISIFISIFITGSLTFFVSFIFEYPISISYYCILLINLIFIISDLFYFKHIINKKIINKNILFYRFYNLLKNNIFLIMLNILLLYCVYYVNFPEKLRVAMDQWQYYGLNIKLITNSIYIPFSSQDYWSSMYNGLFLYMSGIPFINAYLILTMIITIFPILLFYIFSRNFLNKECSIISTIIYSLFFGFGGIIVIYNLVITKNDLYQIINNVANKTYDLWYFHQPFSPYYIPKTISFSVMFCLMNLILNKKIYGKKQITITSILYALFYLWHISEAIFFTILIIPVILFYKKDIINTKVIISIIFGIFIVFIYDSLAPVQAYFESSSFTIEPNLNIYAALIFLIPLLAYILLKLNPFQNIDIFINKYKYYFMIITSIFLYISIFLLLVWIYNYNIINIYNIYPKITWYVYPLRTGIALFLSIISILILIKNNYFGKFIFIIIIIITSISLVEISNFVEYSKFSIIFPEYRILEYAWIGISILAAICLYQFIVKIKKVRNIFKKYFYIFSLTIILFIGISSTFFMMYSFADNIGSATINGLEAMDYLRLHTSSNVSILPSSPYCESLISDFSGKQAVSQQFLNYIFKIDNSEQFNTFLEYNMYNQRGFPIGYFVLRKTDLPAIDQFRNSYLINYIKNEPPIIFDNDEITIFKLPILSNSSYGRGLIIEDKILLKGNIQVDSQSFLLGNALGKVNSNSINNSKNITNITINAQDEYNININGSYNLIFHSSTIEVIKNSNNYQIFKINNESKITVLLSNGSKALINVKKDSVEKYYYINNNFTLYYKNNNTLSLLISNPYILINGEINIKNAFITWPYGFLSIDKDVKINGISSFNIKYDYIIELKTNSNISIINTNINKQIEINYKEVFFSVPNILIILMIILIHLLITRPKNIK